MHSTRRRYHVRSLVGAFSLAALLVLAAASPAPAAAQGQEPSPVAIELVTPLEASPGQAVELEIRYDARDLNAGADINYNVYGPCRILTRDPLPPDPAFNTWLPSPSSRRGTIRVQIQIDPDSDGRVIDHDVQVRWGGKSRSFSAQTHIKYVPPTATPPPSATPVPTAGPAPTSAATPGATSPTPTLAPTLPPSPTLSLTELRITDQRDRTLTKAETGDQLALDVSYASNAPLTGIQVRVRFKPDVVNLEGFERVGDAYVVDLTTLEEAPEGGTLLEGAMQGRIRPHTEGGWTYELQATVEVALGGTAEDAVVTSASGALLITQALSVVVDADVEEGTVFRAGGSVILHATATNMGRFPVRGLKLRVVGLPADFEVTPGEQTIGAIDAQGGSEKRRFAISTPEDHQGTVEFKLVAVLEDKTIESRPLNVVMAAPVPLDIQVTTDRSVVYAGDQLRITVNCTNKGALPSFSIAAKLLDATGNLEPVVQDVGDLAAGESRELSYALPVPPDFPLDTAASLVVQTISGDGTESYSAPQAVRVVCAPDLEVSVLPPIGETRSGTAAEALVSVHNRGICAARDVAVSVVGLPTSFVAPPAQTLAELPAGALRELTFNLLVPPGYRGQVSLEVEAADAGGTRVRVEPVAFEVTGTSRIFVVVFGLLVLLAATAVVVGVALYFRSR